MRSAVLWFLFWPFLLALKVRDKALHRGRVEERVENPTRALECGPEQKAESRLDVTAPPITSIIMGHS